MKNLCTPKSERSFRFSAFSVWIFLLCCGALRVSATPTITYNPIQNPNCIQNLSFNATIADPAGILLTLGNKPRLYYKKHSNSNSIIGNTNATDGWKYVEYATNSGNNYSFQMNLSLLFGGLPQVGDTVDYFVVAANLSGAVSANKATFFHNYTPPSVALNTFAFPASGFNSFVYLPQDSDIVLSTPASVCYGYPDTLSISVYRNNTKPIPAQNNSTIGDSYYGIPFSSYTNGKSQFLITVAELKAQGMVAGNINSMGMKWIYGGAYLSQSDFWVRMGTSQPTTDLSSHFDDNSTYTQVFFGNPWTISVGRTSTMNFAVPYYWDGQSDIVVEFCFGNTAFVNPPQSVNTAIEATETNYPSYRSAISGNPVSGTNICSSTSFYYEEFQNMRPMFYFNANYASPNQLAYAWSDTAHNALGVANPLVIPSLNFFNNTRNAVKFYVTATDQNGCQILDSVVVQKNIGNPHISYATSSSQTPCAGDSIALIYRGVGGCGSYIFYTQFKPATTNVWGNLPLSATNRFSPPQSGMLRVILSDANGKRDTALVDTVMFTPPPLVFADSVCGFGQGFLSAVAQGGGQLYWFDRPNVLTANRLYTGNVFATPTLNRPTKYYVGEGNYVGNAATVSPYVFATNSNTAYGNNGFAMKTKLHRSVVLDSIGISIGATTSACTALIGIYDSISDNVATNFSKQPTETFTISIPGGVGASTLYMAPVGQNVAAASYPATKLFYMISSTCGNVLNYFQYNGNGMYRGGNITGILDIVGSVTQRDWFDAPIEFAYCAFSALEFSTYCGSPLAADSVKIISAPALALSANAVQICDKNTNTSLTPIHITSPLNNYTSYNWYPLSVYGSAYATGFPTSGYYLSAIADERIVLEAQSFKNNMTCTVYDTVTIHAAPFTNTSVLLTENEDSFCIGQSVRIDYFVSQPATNMPSVYCPSQATAIGDEEILNVQFDVINNTTACASLRGSQGLATGSPDLYSDFTASTVPVPDIYAGRTYLFSGDFNNCSFNTWNNSVKVWIDWNRNGSFEDSGEVYLLRNDQSQNGGILSSITAPTHLTPGKTRMRVSIRENDTSGFTSCYTGSWGETEDYALNLVGYPAQLAHYQWYSDSTHAAVLDMDSILQQPVAYSQNRYKAVASISGCYDTAYSNTVYGIKNPLKPFDTTISKCGNSDRSNVFFRDPNPAGTVYYHWYKTLSSTTPLFVEDSTLAEYGGITQIGLDTFYVAAVLSSGGCEGARARIIYNTTLPSGTFAYTANGSSANTIHLCEGSAIQVAVSSVPANFYTGYSWYCADINSGANPSLGSGNGSQTLQPLQWGTYVYQLTASNAQCAQTQWFTAVVDRNPFLYNGAPVPMIATASPNTACIGTAISLESSIGSVANIPPSGYCTPNILYSGSGNIIDVSLSTLNNKTSMNSLVGTCGVATGSVGIYSDFTGVGNCVPTLSAGSIYTISATVNWPQSASVPSATKVWIDWNQDGAFDNVSEGYVLGQSDYGDSIVPETYTRQIQVPSNALLGKTTMRVMELDFTDTFQISPCLLAFFGEGEDYYVDIVSSLAGATYQWQSDSTGNAVLSTQPSFVNNLNYSSVDYKVSVHLGVCADSAAVNVNNATSPFGITTTSGLGSINKCDTQIYSVVADGGCWINGNSDHYLYAWTSHTGYFVGGNNGKSVQYASYGNTAHASDTIKVVATDNAGAKDSAIFLVNYYEPKILAAVGDTICGMGMATLSISPNTANESRWYHSKSADDLAALGTDSVFTTPLLSGADTFYAQSFVAGIAQISGESNCSPSPFDVFSGPNYGLSFTANAPLYLDSLDIYSFGASAFQFAVYQNGEQTPFYTSPIFPTPTAINVKVSLPAGLLLSAGNYRIAAAEGCMGDFGGSTPSGGQNFPYSIGKNLGSITGAFFDIGGDSVDYFYPIFYNLNFHSACISSRVAVPVHYNQPPSLTLSQNRDTVCGALASDVILLNGSSQYSNFTWNPLNGGSQPSLVNPPHQDVQFAETPTGSPKQFLYELVATQSSGTFCEIRDTFTLDVRNDPEPILKSFDSVQVCLGSYELLSAVSGSLTTGQIADDSLIVPPYNAPNVGSNNNPNERNQFIYTAQELSASGMQAGYIQSFAFRLDDAPASVENYEVRFGLATKNDYSTPNFVNTGLSLVYAAPVIYPQLGISYIEMQTPFYWDGISNLVVDIQTGSPNYTVSSSCYYTSTSDYKTLYAYNSGFYSVGWGAAQVSGNPLTSRPNIYFRGSTKGYITWSPTAGLSLNQPNEARDSVWAQPSVTTQYYITATRDNYCTAKDSIKVIIQDTIHIVAQPKTDSTLCQGQGFSVSVSLLSSNGISYQWQFYNGSAWTNIAGATTNIYTKTNATSADSGQYRCQISSGGACGIEVSNIGNIHVLPGLTIAQNASQLNGKLATLCIGSPFNLVAHASGYVSQQWYKIQGNVKTPFSTLDSNHFASSQLTDSGFYYVEYTLGGTCGKAYSDTVQVRLIGSSSIVGDTVFGGGSYCEGGSITLSANAQSTIGYQWFLGATALTDGAVYSGSTTKTLTIAHSTTAQAGKYRLLARSGGFCLHDTSTLGGQIAIMPKLSITSLTLPNAQYCAGATMNFSVMAINNSRIVWYGGINGTDSINNVPSFTLPATAGKYSVKVFGNAPCADSARPSTTTAVTPLATITTPQIALNPVCQGSSTTLSVNYTHADSVVWFRGTVRLGFGFMSGGASILTANTAGSYTARAFGHNACNVVDSTSAPFVVNQKPTISSLTLPFTDYCVGATMNFSVMANNYSRILWRGGATGNDSLSNATSLTLPAASGIYSVRVFGNAPCTDTLKFSVTTKVSQLATITTPVITQNPICQNQTAEISANYTNADSVIWFKSGVRLGSGYIVGSKSVFYPNMAGAYTARAYAHNFCNAVDSTSAVLVVDSLAVIVSNPLHKQYIFAGQTDSMTVKTNGKQDSIVWFRNGVRVGLGTNVSATKSTLILTNFDSATQAGIYTARVYHKASCGGSLVSTNDTVLKTVCPAISVQPLGDTACVGGNVTLTLIAEAVNTYQWYKGTTAIPSATGASYTIANGKITDSGTYSVVLTPLSGCTTNTTSNSVKVGFESPITINVQPAASQTICAGNTLNLNVAATGGSGNKIHYQWQKGGSNIGTDSNAYKVATTTATDSGTYTVIINTATGNCPSATSTNAKVTINTAPSKPIITSSANPICTTNSLTLTANATNATSYVWTLPNGTTQTTTANTLTQATTPIAGNYTVTAKAQAGCADSTSTAFTQTVTPQAAISNVSPATQYLLQGGTVQFSVSTNGNEDSVVWFQNGTRVGTGTTYTKANFDSIADSGIYTARAYHKAPCAGFIATTIGGRAVKTNCPVFTTQPVGDTICENGFFVLNATVVGYNALMWYKDGNSTGIATNNFSNPSATQAQAQGWYKLRAIPFNSIACPNGYYSDNVYVKIDKPIQITSQPKADTSCNPSSMTISATFTGTATGYQWFRNGNFVATMPTINIARNTAVSYYRLKISSRACPDVWTDSVKVQFRSPTTLVSVPTANTPTLVEQCVENGWTYYATPTNDQQILFAIRKNGNKVIFYPHLEVNTDIVTTAPSTTPYGAVFGNRLFNIDSLQGVLIAPYDVKFYYNSIDSARVMTQYSQILAGNSNYQALRGNLSWLATSNVRLSSNMLTSSTVVPLSVPFTVSTNNIYGRESGTNGVVSSAILSNFLGNRGGGVMYMDYQLKNASAIRTTTNAFGIKLFPVPITEGKDLTLEITSKDFSPIQITITDMTGRTIETREIRHTQTTTEHTFDMSKYANGTYNLMMTNGTSYETSMFNVNK